MSKFVYKANNDQPFNNYGSTSKSGKASFSNTTIKDNNRVNAAGQVVDANNQSELEGKIQIDPARNGGAATASAANNDPISGLPPCPGSQTRVGFTIDGSIGGCGCWVSTGLSLTDLLTLGGAAAADTIWSFVKKGSTLSRKQAAIDSVTDTLKKNNNFDQTWQNKFDTLKQTQKNALDKKNKLNKDLAFAENVLDDVSSQLQLTDIELENLSTIINHLQTELANPFLIEYDLNRLNQQLQTYLLRQDKVITARDRLLQRRGLALQEISKINSDLDANTKTLSEVYDGLNNWDKDKQAAELNLISEATNQVNNMNAQQILTLALSWVGFALSALEISREKICLGQNTKLNKDTCSCECTDPDNMTACEGQATITSSILGIVVPDVEELQTFCTPKCSCGQVLYQIANAPCQCACLGEVPLAGTIVGGGGSVDDYFKAGEGCDCLQPGFLWSTRGKCISRDVENRALAQGKAWDGSICDFVCPNGDPDPCVGNATRPPNINYNGFMLEDECGDCICDGNTFTCNEEEGYVKDTSLGVCDCVYAPVSSENINLIP